MRTIQAPPLARSLTPADKGDNTVKLALQVGDLMDQHEAEIARTQLVEDTDAMGQIPSRPDRPS